MGPFNYPLFETMTAFAPALAAKSLGLPLLRLLLGVGDLEKRIGKKAFKDVLGKYVVKPVGAPTLVPESDSRKPYSDAATDFKN